MFGVALVAGLIAAGSAFYGAKQQKRAQEAAEDQRKIEQKMTGVQRDKDRRLAYKEFLRNSAEVKANIVGNTGGTLNSAYAGGPGGMQTQFASNVGHNNTMNAGNAAINGYATQIAGFNRNTQIAGAIGGTAASVTSMYGGWESAFSNMGQLIS
jgi:hypothetical protein